MAQLDSMHPSADHKGLTLLSGLMTCVALISTIVAGISFIYGERAIHLIWALPAAVVATFVVSLLSLSIGGRLAGLRPTGRRTLQGVWPVTGLGAGAIYIAWLPPDDAPAWSRYWRLFAWNVALETGYCAALIVAAAIFRHEPLARDFLFACAAGAAGMVSTMLGKSQPPAAPTIGDMLRQLAQDGPAARRFDALGRIAAATKSGKFPEEWDTSLVVRMLEPRDGSPLQLNAMLNAYTHYAEVREFARADEILLAARVQAQMYPPAVRSLVEVEYAYAQALRGDPIVARAALEQVSQRYFREPVASLMRAALAIREHRRDVFEGALGRLKAAPQNPMLAREIVLLESRANDEFSSSAGVSARPV